MAVSLRAPVQLLSADIINLISDSSFSPIEKAASIPIRLLSLLSQYHQEKYVSIRSENGFLKPRIACNSLVSIATIVGLIFSWRVRRLAFVDIPVIIFCVACKSDFHARSSCSSYLCAVIVSLENCSAIPPHSLLLLSTSMFRKHCKAVCIQQ